MWGVQLPPLLAWSAQLLMQHSSPYGKQGVSHSSTGVLAWLGVQPVLRELRERGCCSG